MNALKTVATIVLSVLLFLSLSLFGIAVLLKFTALNPDFVVAQTDRLDFQEVARDFVEEEVDPNIPAEAEFLKDIGLQVIVKYEPWAKEQLSQAIHDAYDYLQGRRDDFRIVIGLEDIKRDMREDLWAILQENRADWLSGIIDADILPDIDENLDTYLSTLPAGTVPPDIIAQGGPALRQYLVAYLSDTSRHLDEGTLDPDTSELVDFLVRPYYDQYYDLYIENVPDDLSITETDISPEAMVQLQRARNYLGYFPWFFYGLIGFMLLLVGGIVLINRNVKVTTRSLGIDLLVFGAIEFGSVIFLRGLNILSWFPDIPNYVATWSNETYRNLLLPLQWYGLGILILGVILLVTSFVYRPAGRDDS